MLKVSQASVSRLSLLLLLASVALCPAEVILQYSNPSYRNIVRHPLTPDPCSRRCP